MAPRIFWRRARISAGIALALGLVAVCGWLFAVNWQPAVKDFPKQGIDVAAAQGAINWWAVKADGVSFAYARATIGAAERDARFAENWRALFETGIPRGAIHVFSLCQLAADQAGNFVATVPRSPDQLSLAVELDFAPDCAARPARDVVIGEIGRFLTAVETHTGKPALLKISRAFEAYYRISESIPRPLWSVQPFFPPGYFDKPWSMWQASSFRRIEGVGGAVGWDVIAR
ncbi:MAG: GH25 family lysozyme [Sphingomonas sp.]